MAHVIQTDGTAEMGSHTVRIIVEGRNGKWAAWYENRPEVAFDGRTPTKAAFRLTGPDEKPQTWRDRSPMLSDMLAVRGVSYPTSERTSWLSGHAQ